MEDARCLRILPHPSAPRRTLSPDGGTSRYRPAAPARLTLRIMDDEIRAALTRMRSNFELSKLQHLALRVRGTGLNGRTCGLDCPLNGRKLA
jgi:hypothetical protein